MDDKDKRDFTDKGPIEEGEVLGCTRVSPRGYFVRVERVIFRDQQGGRIRITLLKQAQGVTEFIRGMDLTTRLAAEVGVLLARVDE
jgi:hypothetical protein